MCKNVMRVFEIWFELREEISAAQTEPDLQLTRESNRARIVHCIRPHTLFLFAVLRSSQPSSVHQRVSVGHYLLHPNNREFTQRTRTTLANHRPGALLLTPDLSTHTMFIPYISAESSASPHLGFTQRQHGNKKCV